MLNFKNPGRIKIAKLRDHQFENTCVRQTCRKYSPTIMVCFSLSAVVSQGIAAKNLAITAIKKQHLSKH